MSRGGHQNLRPGCRCHLAGISSPSISFILYELYVCKYPRLYIPGCAVPNNGIILGIESFSFYVLVKPSPELAYAGTNVYQIIICACI